MQHLVLLAGEPRCACELQRIEQGVEAPKTVPSLIVGPRPVASIFAQRIAFPLLFLAAGLMFAEPCAGGVFFFTDSLNTARALHSATLLPNGTVLAAGGQDSEGNALVSAELYDPATGSWTVTGSMHTSRWSHTATLLPDGKVLVAGGNFDGIIFSSAELYDPTTGSWTTTGSMATPRHSHTATLLPNGQVLVAGGFGGIGNINVYLSSSELYDPATGMWTATGSMGDPRAFHTATLLTNGMVLVAGGPDNSGIASASAELYDPATGGWTATGSLTSAREGHSATLLPNGKVLVAGGSGSAGVLSSAELFDPATGGWTTTGSMATARVNHTATLLPGGMVLVAGGSNGVDALASAEFYDPTSGSWSATGSLNIARAYYTATLLPNGTVLVAGGFDPVSASAEFYDPAIPAGKALNISTRVDVKTGDNVAIGGFIITGGTTPKTVIIRALGPSLLNANPPVVEHLADPVLELHKPDGSIVTNDNWKDNTPADQAIIVAKGLDQSNGQPINDLESVIVATLPPEDPAVSGSGAYTAIVSGSGGGTGIGLVEVYDLDDPAAVAELANISTRGFVGIDVDVLIGGVIIGPIGGSPAAGATVVVRAIGPSLANAVPPVAGPLADPYLELFDANGNSLVKDDNWQDDPVTAAEIQALGLAPANAKESAILANLGAGSYTAIVTDVNHTTGVGLVEVFRVPTPMSSATK